MKRLALTQGVSTDVIDVTLSHSILLPSIIAIIILNLLLDSLQTFYNRLVAALGLVSSCHVFNLVQGAFTPSRQKFTTSTDEQGENFYWWVISVKLV